MEDRKPKAAVRVVHRNDRAQIKRVLAGSGQALLPMLELLEGAQASIDELMHETAVALVEQLLVLSAQELADVKRRGRDAAPVLWHGSQRGVLPVPYFHLVFTLPHALNGLAGRHARAIYETLFEAAWQTLTEFGASPRWLGGMLAFTLVLHTWAQDSNERLLGLEHGQVNIPRPRFVLTAIARASQRSRAILILARAAGVKSPIRRWRATKGRSIRALAATVRPMIGPRARRGHCASAWLPCRL